MKKLLFVSLLIVSLIVLPGCAALDVLLATATPEAQAPAPPAVQPAAYADEDSSEDELAEGAALTQGQVLDALQAHLVELYEDINPSVVSIRVAREAAPNSFRLPQDFESPDMPLQQGSGSGFVWDQEGHIVTNYHVIEGAEKITVRFYDDRTLSAEVVGADPDSDLAVLKVDADARDLAPVRLATGPARVGELAVAVGSPFGLENTMTVGFISAVGRSLPANSTYGGGSYTIPEIIQTDAPINPGNSGGVLVNDKGEVVGVNTAIVSTNRASAGVGFAIPVARVQAVVPQLIEDGSYAHAWLGISGTTLNAEMAQAMDLDADQRGALVIEVVPGGPAEEAGLRGSERTLTIDGFDVLVGGDVIVALEGEEIRDFEDLVAALGRHQAGETVSMTVLRDGAPEELPVTLGTRPAE